MKHDVLFLNRTLLVYICIKLQIITITTQLCLQDVVREMVGSPVDYYAAEPFASFII